jgi:hypothetical protein
MSDSDADRIVVVRDMGLSHLEFFRSLQPLAREWQCQIRDDGVLIDYDGGEIDIVLGKEGRRKIAAMSLPRTEVRFCFSRLNALQRKGFFYRFDLAYRRGGG